MGWKDGSDFSLFFFSSADNVCLDCRLFSSRSQYPFPIPVFLFSLLNLSSSLLAHFISTLCSTCLTTFLSFIQWQAEIASFFTLSLLLLVQSLSWLFLPRAMSSENLDKRWTHFLLAVLFVVQICFKYMHFNMCALWFLSKSWKYDATHKVKKLL